jgi:hypothetical protein
VINGRFSGSSFANIRQAVLNVANDRLAFGGLWGPAWQSDTALCGFRGGEIAQAHERDEAVFHVHAGGGSIVCRKCETILVCITHE